MGGYLNYVCSICTFNLMPSHKYEWLWPNLFKYHDKCCHQTLSGPDYSSFLECFSDNCSGIMHCTGLVHHMNQTMNFNFNLSHLWGCGARFTSSNDALAPKIFARTQLDILTPILNTYVKFTRRCNYEQTFT
jgi:hypothetical protein